MPRKGRGKGAEGADPAEVPGTEPAVQSGQVTKGDEPAPTAPKRRRTRAQAASNQQPLTPQSSVLSTPEAHGRLVVVGSSAGGIQALSVLVSTLPSNFPAPVVLAQHLDPHRPSSLPTILERRSALPIVVVQDSTLLEPGKVYVVPANRHVSIQDGHVGLERDHGDRPRPSVDLLLTSAAASYGEGLVAVILTGAGSDGAAGAVEVKQAGGVVVIQDPETARYPSMPLALPPTAVDHVANLEDIGPLLMDLVSGSPPMDTGEYRTEPGDPLREILAQVTRQANIDFSQYKPATIVRRISRRMAATHHQTLDDYERYVKGHPEEVSELVRAFLIKVTEFFRDPEAFRFLRSNILPELLESARARGNVLRVWSAGCATGEEAYSLAILIADVLGPELGNWKVKIFATDLDEGALAFARRGLYPENVLSHLPGEFRSRYFESVDQGFRISKTLRQMVIFGQQDLGRGVPFPRINLVVCRNLLIYFQPELQQSVLETFSYSLHSTSGYLFLGHAETVRPSAANYQIVSKRWKVYRCVRPPRALAPRLVEGEDAPASAPPDRAQKPKFRAAGAARTGLVPGALSFQQSPEVEQLRRFNELVLRYLPAGVVVIDRHYRIASINSTARRLLGIREVSHDLDFLHAIRGLPYNEVRAGIDNVFRDNTTHVLPEIELDVEGGGSGRHLSFTIATVEIEVGSPELAMVCIQDVSEVVETRQSLESVQAEQRKLLQELQTTNRRLADMNRDLQDANDELQATNEELMLAQEELQATNEEFEATNEELQATNEELETNNEELQATNEELETTNEELYSRSGEFQELSRALARERGKLSEMVGPAPFGILILRGPGLLIEAFNPSYGRIFQGREVAGLPIEDVLEYDLPQLVPLIRQAFEKDKQRVALNVPTKVARPDGGTDDCVYDYTIVPLHDDESNVDGVVAYAEDVTQRLEHEAEESRERVRLLVENVQGISLGLYDAHTSKLLNANRDFIAVAEGALGIPGDRVVGSTWQQLRGPIFGEEVAGRIFQEALKGEGPVRFPEMHLRMADGRETVWMGTLAPIPEEPGSGQVRYLVSSAVEITEQARAREELERLDRMKDFFLSSASHELRTPLTPLVAYTSMLERAVTERENDPGWDPKISDYARRLRKQLNQIRRLVDDLFDVARLQSGKLSLQHAEVDLAQVVIQAASDARHFSDRHEIRVQQPGGGDGLVVSGDEGRLTQVLTNLLHNAIKYSGDGSKIDVRLDRERDGERDVAVLQVRDYGRGIAPEDLPSIFNRFYQGSDSARKLHDGLGLGLSIAKAIIEQHGGTITAESQVGEGSTFTIRLPLAGEA